LNAKHERFHATVEIILAKTAARRIACKLLRQKNPEIVGQNSPADPLTPAQPSAKKIRLWGMRDAGQAKRMRERKKKTAGERTSL
jgi:hypothetical protein